MTEPSPDPTAAASVVVERRGAVAIVILSAAATRNALTTTLMGELADALDALDRDPEIAAAVITGGPRVFASGADVRELLATTPVQYARSERTASWRRLGAVGLPLVAGVAGWALGGGCELALLCDLVVAADTAVFGQPELRLGILPGAGGTQRWSRVAGRFAAAEVVLNGRTVDAFRARELKLVNRLVPAERVIEGAAALAAEVASRAPLAVRAAKAALRRAEELPLSAALDYERDQLLRLLATEDRTEGIQAFLERRDPAFVGR